MTTINDLVSSTHLSRYYVTKAIRIMGGVKIKRGRNPTVLNKDAVRKVRKTLRTLLSAKNLQFV